MEIVALQSGTTKKGYSLIILTHQSQENYICEVTREKEVQMAKFREEPVKKGENIRAGVKWVLIRKELP